MTFVACCRRPELTVFLSFSLVRVHLADKELARVARPGEPRREGDGRRAFGVGLRWTPLAGRPLETGHDSHDDDDSEWPRPGREGDKFVSAGAAAAARPNWTLPDSTGLAATCCCCCRSSASQPSRQNLNRRTCTPPTNSPGRGWPLSTLLLGVSPSAASLVGVVVVVAVSRDKRQETRDRTQEQEKALMCWRFPRRRDLNLSSDIVACRPCPAEGKQTAAIHQIAGFKLESTGESGRGMLWHGAIIVGASALVGTRATTKSNKCQRVYNNNQ